MNVKKYLEKRIRGWLPKEPELKGIAQASGRRKKQAKKDSPCVCGK